MEMVAHTTALADDTRIRCALSVADFKAASALYAHLTQIGVKDITFADCKNAFQKANQTWADAMSARVVS